MKKYPRESYILQTKVVPKASTDEFRTTLEKSFSDLQLTAEGNNPGGYVDLFSFHGLNIMDHIEWINRPGNGFITLFFYPLLHPLFQSIPPTPTIVQVMVLSFSFTHPFHHPILPPPLSTTSLQYPSSPLPPLPLQPPLSTHPLDPLN